LEGYNVTKRVLPLEKKWFLLNLCLHRDADSQGKVISIIAVPEPQSPKNRRRFQLLHPLVLPRTNLLQISSEFGLLALLTREGVLII
jgi:hypothetical protein